MQSFNFIVGGFGRAHFARTIMSKNLDEYKVNFTNVSRSFDICT